MQATPTPSRHASWSDLGPLGAARADHEQPSPTWPPDYGSMGPSAPAVAIGLPALFLPPHGADGARSAPAAPPGRWSSVCTAARTGLRNGLLIGTALAGSFAIKAGVLAGLGEVQRHHPDAFEGLALAGLSVATGVGAWLGGRVLAQAVQALSGVTFPERATRALQVTATAGALAANLAPALLALDNRDSAALGTALLANNAAHMVFTLSADFLVHLTLHLGGRFTDLVDAAGHAVLPGTPEFQRHFLGEGSAGRLAALVLPALLVHALSIHAANQGIAPLAHALDGPAPADSRFGQDGPTDTFTANFAVGLMVAAVEVMRRLGTDVAQATYHAMRGMGVRLPAASVPAAVTVPPAASAGLSDRVAGAARGLGHGMCEGLRAVGQAAGHFRFHEEAQLRFLGYSTFLNLTVGALITGPNAAPVRWTTHDAGRRVQVASALSIVANTGLVLTDVLNLLARHQRTYRPAPRDGAATVELVVDPAPGAGPGEGPGPATALEAQAPPDAAPAVRDVHDAHDAHDAPEVVRWFNPPRS